MTSTLIVNYHYCLTAAEEPHLARTAISPKRFARQVAALGEVMKTRRGWLDCALTFDDGTKGNFSHALPIIVQHGIPTIMFVCSLPLVDRRLLNVTKIHMLQARLGFERFRASVLKAANGMSQSDAGGGPVDGRRLYRYDTAETRELKLLLNVYLPYPVVTRLLDELFESELGSQAEAAERIYMSLDELRCCLRAGIRLGTHTHSHAMLSRLPRGEQDREIALPLDFFRTRLGLETRQFAYPYGVETTWTGETKELLTRHGISEAYTLGRRIYQPERNSDPLEIPRFDVNDVFDTGDSVKTSVLSS